MNAKEMQVKLESIDAKYSELKVEFSAAEDAYKLAEERLVIMKKSGTEEEMTKAAAEAYWLLLEKISLYNQMDDMSQIYGELNEDYGRLCSLPTYSPIDLLQAALEVLEKEAQKR